MTELEGASDIGTDTVGVDASDSGTVDVDLGAGANVERKSGTVKSRTLPKPSRTRKRFSFPATVKAGTGTILSALKSMKVGRRPSNSFDASSNSSSNSSSLQTNRSSDSKQTSGARGRHARASTLTLPRSFYKTASPDNSYLSSAPTPVTNSSPPPLKASPVPRHGIPLPSLMDGGTTAPAPITNSSPPPLLKASTVLRHGIPLPSLTNGGGTAPPLVSLNRTRVRNLPRARTEVC